MAKIGITFPKGFSGSKYAKLWITPHP
jgi:hypothetical protein